MFLISRGYHKFEIYMWSAIALPIVYELSLLLCDRMIKIRDKISVILLKKAMMDPQHKSMACGPVLQFGSSRQKRDERWVIVSAAGKQTKSPSDLLI